MPYLSTSAVMIHKEALYQVYLPLQLQHMAVVLTLCLFVCMCVNSDENWI